MRGERRPLQPVVVTEQPWSDQLGWQNAESERIAGVCTVRRHARRTCR